MQEECVPVAVINTADIVNIDDVLEDKRYTKLDRVRASKRGLKVSAVMGIPIWLETISEGMHSFQFKLPMLTTARPIWVQVNLTIKDPLREPQTVLCAEVCFNVARYCEIYL